MIYLDTLINYDPNTTEPTVEPFVDTIVICTVTALVIVITGMYDNRGDLTGIALKYLLFQSHLFEVF